MTLAKTHIVCSLLRTAQFAQMQRVYGSTGGFVACELVRGLPGSSESQALSTVAKRIIARTMVNFQWSGETWVPTFQMGEGEHVMKPYMPETLHELVDVFDDWEIALWFTQPNSLLSGCAPAVAMREDPASVFLAARADRFIAKG